MSGDQEPRGRGQRAVEAVSGMLPRSVLRWAVSRSAPVVRLSGWTSIGSTALSKALVTLAQPPRHLFSRSGTLNVEQVADRFNREPEEIRRWQRLGLIEPNTDSLDRQEFDRALLVDLALNEGADEARLAQAARDGGLVWAALDSALTSGGGLSGAEAARDADISMELYEAIWQALGLPIGDLELAAFDRRDVHALRTLRALNSVFSSEDLTEASSVVGRAMAEVSKVVIDVFRRRLAEPLLESGGTDTDVVVRLAAMRDLLVPALAPLLEVALRRHLAAAVRSEMTMVTEQMLAPGEGHRIVSVAFADLVGFTAASEELPPAEVGRLASTLMRIAENAVSRGGGRIIKGIGDAVMFTAADPVQCAKAAAEIVAAVQKDQSLPPVRVGIGHGPVLPAYADYFGRTVNLASRLCSTAAAGEILVHIEGEAPSEQRWAEAGLRVSDRRSRQLKGVAEEVPVLAVAALSSAG